MKATDGDKDRQHNIVYFLTGQGIDPDNPANSKFDINRTSGEIYVLKVASKKTCRFLSVLILIFFIFYNIFSMNSLLIVTNPMEGRNGVLLYLLKTKVEKA